MSPRPASAYAYRNGSDIDSDNAYEARRSQEWIAQSDSILARRAQEVTLDDSPLPMTADGRVILPSGRIVRPSVSVSAAEPALDFAADIAARRGAISFREATARASLGAATADDLRILGQFPASQRIDSSVPAWGPSALARADGSPATYSFDERTKQAYWNLGEDNLLREIPKAFKQPSLQELAFADPNNPFTNGPRLGIVLGEFGVVSGAGAFGLGVGGVAARGLMGLAADTSAYGLRAAYLVNANGINASGLLGAEIGLGYDALSPSPMLLGGGVRNALRGTVGADGQAVASSRAIGTVLSGHGSYEIGSGLAVVPEGTSMTVYSKFGATISNDLGNVIETGGDLSSVYKRIYGPGEKMPNYTLHAPTGLDIQGNPVTVDTPTLLTDLLKPGMGNCHWAACTYNWKASNANIVFDTVGIGDTQGTEWIKQWIKIYSKDGK
jgi:hypothetical protein